MTNSIKKVLKTFMDFSTWVLVAGAGFERLRPPGYEPDELPLLYPAMF